VQYGIDCCRLLVDSLVRDRGVDDVEDEVGYERLLQRCREALDELCRQAADEADRVREQVASAFELEAAGCRVERLEEAIVDGDLRPSECVEKCRLPHVRVTSEGYGRRLRATPLLPPNLALLAEFLQPASQECDPAAREPAVALELRFPWPSRADPASEALEVLPEAAHAREVVLELRKLDLELSLGASRVLGEDVENQLRSVHDPCLESILEHALLRRIELAVNEQHLRAGIRIVSLELLELSFAEVRAPSRAGPVLNELADRLDEGGPRELPQLCELPARIDSLSQHGGDEPALERRLGLA